MKRAGQRVLIVEDEHNLAQGVRFNLEAEGYDADVVDTGEAALERLLGQARTPYDLVVLDVMLPGKDGFAVVSELRAARQFVPVLMLTARGRPEDVLRGFESGADDYLPKPFELAVLIARLNGLLRRRQWFHLDRDNSVALDKRDYPFSRGRQANDPGTNGSSPGAENDIFTFGGKTIDFRELELRTGEQTVRLTLMEAEVLRYLINHEGHVVSRRSLLEDVWGLREDTDTRAIDNFVVRLRKYIEDVPSRPQHLLTVRGVGYRFVKEPAG